MMCVLCGSTNSKELYDFGERKVVECKTCGLARTQGVAGFNYKHYHRDEDYLKFEKMFQNIFFKRLKIIERFAGGGRRVLDIGASTGTFLKLFKEKGWETWGIEPSRSGDVAREKGIKILKETLAVNQPSKILIS